MKYVEGSKRVFLDTGTRFPREMIWGISMVKFAAARANMELGLLDEKRGRAIIAAAREVIEGRHDSMVVVDVFQTGSGTGLNMNLNELIAEVASRSSGLKIHPNDHVNMSQSSNDVGPTVVRVSSVRAVHDELIPAVAGISKRLAALSTRTATAYKAGRTHLRDALPVTMGQEFGAFADAFSRDAELLAAVAKFSMELPIGGTAVGTGLNADPKFGTMVAADLKRETRIPFLVAKNRFRATRLLTDSAALSGAIRTVALDLYRLCQDIRLMFSGPKTGFGEIDIPSQEEVAGSSIMPGKTNPVTVESALLACSEVIGLDASNQFTAGLGEFELAMGVPLMGYNLVMQVKLLSEALRKVSALVVDHVIPNKAHARKLAEMSPALVTVISPKIGYDRAAVVAKKVAGGLSIREALKGLGYGEKEVNRILDMKGLVKAGIPAKKV
jgi:fumarate hydratase, class II